VVARLSLLDGDPASMKVVMWVEQRSMAWPYDHTSAGAGSPSSRLRQRYHTRSIFYHAAHNSRTLVVRQPIL